MTEATNAQLVLQARGVLEWDQIYFGDMFAVDAQEVEAWESGQVDIDDLVVTISRLVLECRARPDLIHEIFDVPGLDEEGVLTLLRFLRDALQVEDSEQDKLEESLLDAIEMMLELTSFRRAQDPDAEFHSPEEDAPSESWDV